MERGCYEQVIIIIYFFLQFSVLCRSLSYDFKLGSYSYLFWLYPQQVQCVCGQEFKSAAEAKI